MRGKQSLNDKRLERSITFSNKRFTSTRVDSFFFLLRTKTEKGNNGKRKKTWTNEFLFQSLNRWGKDLTTVDNHTRVGTTFEGSVVNEKFWSFSESL